MERLRRLLQYDVASWWIITPEVRVDPNAFPENEFPVECMRCGYQLRGLPESVCPECGTPFDRGRLLVEQYVLWRRPRSDRCYRASVWCWRVAVALILVTAISAFSIYIVLRSGWFSPEEAEMIYVCRIVAALIIGIGVNMLGAPLIGVSLLLWWYSSPRHGEKRRRVAEAIQK